MATLKKELLGKLRRILREEGLTLRSTGGQYVIYEKPKQATPTGSERQVAHRTRFSNARKFACHVLKDQALRSYYSNVSPPGKPLYLHLISMYMAG